jgi:hypothetical protein
MPENYVFVPPDAEILADNPNWKNRFKFRSSSGSQYTIAQNVQTGHWGCSCTGWRMRRRCRHLQEFGIPNNEIPYDARLAINAPEEVRRPILNLPPPETTRVDSRPSRQRAQARSVERKPQIIEPPKPKVTDFSKLPRRQFSLDEDV